MLIVLYDGTVNLFYEIFLKATFEEGTLDYLIPQHVGLFFFKKKSALCVLIRSCWFINFRKIFHPVRLLDPVRLFISEKFLLYNNTFYDQFHDGSIFKGQLYLL